MRFSLDFVLPTNLPLITSQVRRVNVVQRRMLRAVVGWVAVDGNDWRGTMRRMNDKVKNVYDFFPVGLMPSSNANFVLPHV